MFDFYAISGKDTFTKIAPPKNEAIKKTAEKEEGKKKIQVYYTGKKRYIGGIKV